jgi:hypothetical protein
MFLVYLSYEWKLLTVLVFSDIPGFVMYVGQNGDTSDIVIPVVEVPLSNYSRILSLVQNYSSLEVTLTSTGNLNFKKQCS